MELNNNMETPEDNELIGKIKETGDSSSLEELCTRHTGLVVNLIRRYYKSGFNQQEVDDAFEERMLIVYKAAQTFKDDMGTQFPTHLGNQVKYHCLNARNKQTKHNNLFTSSDEKISDGNNFQDSSFENYGSKDLTANTTKEVIDREDYKILVEAINNMSSDIERKILVRKYLDSSKPKDCTWKKVSEDFHFTSQSCLNNHDKAIKNLRKEFKKIYEINI